MKQPLNKIRLTSRQSRWLYVTVQLLLLALLIFVCTKISFIFAPLRTFFSTLLGPFLIAGFLYYLLRPLVKLLMKLKMKRRAANITAFVLLLVLVIGGLAVLIPHITSQVVNIVQNLPQLAGRVQKLANQLAGTDIAQGLGLDAVVKKLDFDNQKLIKYLANLLGDNATEISSIVSWIGNALVNIFMAPIILYFLMKNGDRLSGNIQRFCPPARRPFVANLLHRVNTTVETYFTGQFTDMLIVAILSCIGYYIVGTPYALAIGFTAGVMNMVPYIGPWLGAVPAVLVAMTVSWQNVLWAVVVAVAVQQIDNNFVYPNVIGKTLDISPLTVIVILLTAGNIWGLLGVILGIPAYAVVKTVLTCFIAEPNNGFFDYMNSTDEPQADDDVPRS
ncbi:AI-2E family transporter [Lacticaseibacillus thailandensis]|uniref:AI-2E family transporter n=1 Tax=Lacticaseibacillus thailandensis TaxID=381741 RepID=UPI0006D1C3F1|nr:AI-2E family transporter [Lacticaseibacillus thailandensis]